MLLHDDLRVTIVKPVEVELSNSKLYTRAPKPLHTSNMCVCFAVTSGDHDLIRLAKTCKISLLSLSQGMWAECRHWLLSLAGTQLLYAYFLS